MNEKRKVVVFIPCYMDQLQSDTALNMVKILQYFNCKVDLIKHAYCCGQIAYAKGYDSEAKELGKRMSQAINLYNDLDIVIPDAACSSYIKKEISYYKKNKKKSKKEINSIYEFSEYLLRFFKNEFNNIEWETTVTIHDACKGTKFKNYKKSIRSIIEMINGVELVEMQDADTCCGFGGPFALDFPELSSKIGKDKWNNALHTDADWLVSNDSSCLIHIDACNNTSEASLKTIHIVDFIAKSLKIID